jgi:hypothetical protein
MLACFAAGTPLLTPDGAKPIEAFVRGDTLLSRDEYDPSGDVVPKVVEEVFVRLAEVIEVRVGGRTIGTSSEHPFWVVGKGWTPARALTVGDAFIGHDGQSLPVTDIVHTGQWATVYNLRVADFHTYFVGCEEWGVSVWAHNTCFITREIPPNTPGYDASKPYGVWDTLTRRFTGEAFENRALADARAGERTTATAADRSPITAPNKGTVLTTQAAIDQGAKSLNESQKLAKLRETAANLSEAGYDVRILGEATTEHGDLAIKGPKIGSELPVQNKRLDAANYKSVERNITEALDQVAKTTRPGVVVIDGKAAGLEIDIFSEGLGKVLNKGPDKHGTVIVILKDGSVRVIDF